MKKNQQGVSLVEVLVAIFLLMIGLMGVMGIQVFSQRQATTSAQRSIVVQATEMMTERMRANRAGSICGFYLTSGVFSTNPACAAAGDSQALATSDLVEWQQDLVRRLPDVTTVIAGTQANGLNISVRWSERDASATDPACPNGSPVTLRCFNTTFMP